MSRPGGYDPEELEKEFGDSVEYLCARLKLAHSDKQVTGRSDLMRYNSSGCICTCSNSNLETCDSNLA